MTIRRHLCLVLSLAAVLASARGIDTAQAAPAAPAKRFVLAQSQPSYATASNDLGAVAASDTLHARIYLASRDPAALASFARAVSDPNSAQYRRTLSPGQFTQRFLLTPAQRAKIIHWLDSSGVTVTGQSTHYIDVTGTSAQIDTALQAPIHRFRTPQGTLQAPTHDLSVPADIAADVIAVDGLSAQNAARPTAVAGSRSTTTATSSDDPSCSRYFGQLPTSGLPSAYGHSTSYTTCPYTPADLRRAYNVGSATASGAGRTVAVVDAYGSPTARADADAFARTTGDQPFSTGQYRQTVDPASWNVTSACAPPDQWAGEQALDIESVHGYAPKADVLYVGADSCLDQDLMDAEASIIDHHSADIISNSWAEIIHAQPGHLTTELIDAWNLLFEQAAAEGIGVYFAAGDCGDSSPGAAATGLNCDPQTTQAQADFPSGSPWVTSVGGTTLATRRNGRYAWETTMGDTVSIQPGGNGAWAPVPGVFAFGGGGGPSDFAEPWFQRGRIPDALAGVDGQARRLTPDVALEGDAAVPVLIGYTTGGTFQLFGFGGTSAAAPGFAAIQADAEQELGHAIGFADPLLYSLPSAAFHDITAHPTTGRPLPLTVVADQGAAAGDLRYVLYTLGQDYGLTATTGFDEATGLGSPGPAYLSWFRTHG